MEDAPNHHQSVNIAYKRSFASYSFPFGFCLYFLIQALRATSEIYIIWYSISFIGLIGFIWAIIHNKAMVVKEGKLHLYKNYFRHIVIEINTIEDIVQSKNSFSEYEILLNNGKKPVGLSLFTVSIPNIEQLKNLLN